MFTLLDSTVGYVSRKGLRMKTNTVAWSSENDGVKQKITVRGLVMVEIEDIVRFNPHDDVMGNHLLDQKGVKAVLAALREGKGTVDVTTVMTTSRTASDPDGKRLFAQGVIITLPSDDAQRKDLENVLLLAGT